MASRVSPTDRVRADIDAVFTQDRDLAEVLEDVARLGARLILQTALEAEVTEFLGRDRYARGRRARAGSRNGYASKRSRRPPGRSSSPGRSCAAPTPRSRHGCSVRVTRTNALESLVIAGYVRGLSTRDVEASLADALGPEATLSKSMVSRVCTAIAVEFDGWRRGDLSDVELEYLYLDGSVRHEAPHDRVGMKGPHPRSVAADREKLAAA